MRAFLNSLWWCFLVVACHWSTATIAQAHFIDRIATLSPVAHDPPLQGFAQATIQLDLDEIKLLVTIDFDGLSSGSLSASLNGLATDPTVDAGLEMIRLTNFPVGVTSGSFTQEIDLTLDNSYSPAFVAASGGQTFQALNALISALGGEVFGDPILGDPITSYLSISTSGLNGIELRGAITAVPEPFSLALLGLAAVGYTATRARVPKLRYANRRRHVSAQAAECQGAAQAVTHSV